MMLREILYGVEISLNKVKINPFPALTELNASYYYHFGNVEVFYSLEKVVLTLPGEGNTERNTYFNIFHLIPNTAYYIKQVCKHSNSNSNVATSIENNNNKHTALFRNPKVFSLRENLLFNTTKLEVISSDTGLLSFELNKISTLCTIHINI